MPSVRLLSLLVVALAECASLLPTSVGQTTGTDPSSPSAPVSGGDGSDAAAPTNPGCYAYSGDSSGAKGAVIDVGYYQLWGLNSTYSSDYTVLCAFQGYYGVGPNGGKNVWGPWHGNPADSHCDMQGTSFYAKQEYGVANIGSVGVRTNGADGKYILTSFKFGTTCDSSIICAGNCPFSPNYAKQQDDLSADPTYQEIPFGSSGSDGSIEGTQVITYLNSTGATIPVQSKFSGYPTVPVSVISGIAACYGFVDSACGPADDNSSK